MKRTIIAAVGALLIASCAKDKEYQCYCINGGTYIDSAIVTGKKYDDAYNSCKGRELKWKANAAYINTSCNLK